MSKLAKYERIRLFQRLVFDYELQRASKIHG